MALLSSTPGTRTGLIGSFALAVAWTATSFGAALTPAPANAQAPARGYYQVELAQPAKDARTIAGDLVWVCEGTNCVANKGTSRPLRICREVNRKLGEVTAFAVKGEALPAEDLAKCNA